MATKNSFMKVIILLGFVSAGVQGAWADSTVNFWVKDVGYHIMTSFNGKIVEVVSYRGSAETLTIPDYVSNGSSTYQVMYIKDMGSDPSVDISSVSTLIFEGGIIFENSSSNPTFYCPNLSTIIFKGALPTLKDNFNRYFGTRRGITAHVTGKTDEEIEEMKNNTAVWSDFADIVPYNEAVSENVKIYVTTEYASPGNGIMFQDASGQYIYGAGSKVYTKNKHLDYTFYIADGNYSVPKNVYVNGKEVLAEMEDASSDNPFYSGTNPKKYTLENVTADAYIRITAEDTRDQFVLGVGRGGKVTLFDGENVVQNNNTLVFNVNKNEHRALTITPDEGYEFDIFWWDGYNISTGMGDIITVEAQGDGSYVASVSGGGKMVVTFKPVGSGSSTSTYDLNGDGTVDVSDIDKLIEEINKQ